MADIDADDIGESPRPFRRERNLSNRNFARHSARRRFSTDSHSSLDSISATTSGGGATETTSSTSTPTTASSHTAASSSCSSSSMQISYSVNSDTENAFNQKSRLKMRAASEEPGTAATSSEESPPPQTPDPALLGVKQKVLRFETLQAEERIIFKTGKFKSKSLHSLARGSEGPHVGPLRVLPFLTLRKPLADCSFKSSTTSASFHTSIDEERSEDEVEEICDFAADEADAADDAVSQEGEEYILPEEATELKEGDVVPLAPFAPALPLEPADGVSDNVPVLGLDDFGKVEAVRRTMSAVHKHVFGTVSLPPSPMGGRNKSFVYQHSSEQAAAAAEAALSEVTATTPATTPVPEDDAALKTSKNFPRNYRSVPRPKTEINSTKNRHLVGKYNSLYHPKDDDDEVPAEEEQIELRVKYEKSIQNILNELITTEESYVDNLYNGIANYGDIFQRKDLPIGLRGKKYVLLGNIEQIAEFHRDEFLPMLHRNRRDLKRLFEEFQIFIDHNSFYGYVIFTMNKQRSLKLCEVYKNYFKLIQTELDDKLGINSFLVQPIQRLPRYQLLLNTFITMLFKERELIMKPLIESCCRLEKKVRTLLTSTNESEVINDIIGCNEFNVFYQGKFRKVSEFSVLDHTLKRTYRSKVFIFDKCILYTEIKGKQLIFHGRYPCEHIGIVAKTKTFTLFYERRKQQECDFSGDPALIETWLELIRDMISSYAAEERLKLHERYSRENDHLHRQPPSLSLFRDSNRFSSDSGIGNIWVMPKPEMEEAVANNRTTWYAVS